MKLPRKERVSSTVVVIALAGVLAVLAVLQYRWSRDVSEAASDRMKANLQNSMIGMRQDLYRELSGLGMAFQPDPAAHTTTHDGEAFTQRLREWSRTAAHPALVRNVYVLEHAEKDQSQLLRLNTAEGKFEPAEWPSQLTQFRVPLQAISSDLAARVPVAERMLEHHGEELAQHRTGNQFFQRRMMRGGPWNIDLVAPALMHAEINRPAKAGQKTTVAWVILDLDPALIQQHLLPELAQRYFGGPQGLTFDVAVVGNDDRGQVLYSSNPQLSRKDVGVVDAVMPLFGPFGGPIITGSTPGTTARATDPGAGHRHEAGAPGPMHLDPLPLRAQGGDWRLIVKHRKGSLEAAVNSLYRRNLAISFGILLVLAATMTMIVITARRAQRLARLQMEFVAGVSHELRTPLAVINSAAENIADGIVDNKQRLARYGNVIRKQTRQLSQLVEQILLFAATHDASHQYSLKLVDASEIIDLALANTEELTSAAGFEVEKIVAEHLPPVRADVMATAQCLQNLITNAVKYSGDSRTIALRAEAVEKHGSKEVTIAVEDHGLGIAKSELHRIFDPFYRSPAVTAAQIHGTGLGLSLAKKIAEGMCGHVTVESEPGKGSTFTLHLPAAPAGEIAAAEVEPETVSAQNSNQS